MKVIRGITSWLKCVGAIALFATLAPAFVQEVDATGVPMPLRRLEWFYSLRRLPDGTVPADGWLRAWEQAEELPLFQMGDFSPTADPWVFMGPDRTRVFNYPPANGTSYLARVTRIAISPDDPDTIYVGATRGGLWKSTDGGTTWRNLPIAPFANAIGAITLHPNDPNTIFVGTGDEVWFGPGQQTNQNVPTNPINGDVNNDNQIDDADLLRVLFAFGQSCDLCPEDLNGDGYVDDADLLIVLFSFGQTGD